MKLIVNFTDNNNLIIKGKTEDECASILLAFDKAKKADCVKLSQSCLVVKEHVRTIFFSGDDEEVEKKDE